MDDKRLNEIGTRLGARAGENLNVERVAQRVLDRLRSDEVVSTVESKPIRLRAWTMRIAGAAAVILALLGGRFFLQTGSAPASSDVFAEGPLGLEELSHEELTSVLDSLTFDAPVSQTHAVGFSDLSEAELQELLATMED